MIYIVRHGQTSWNVEGRLNGHTTNPLNENGRQEAHTLSRVLATMKIDKIISSDLPRAKETAEIIANELGKEITLDYRLRSVDYGKLSGLIIADIPQSVWDTYNSTPEVFNAESVISAYNRVREILSELQDLQTNILIVTHGGALRVISAYARNRDNLDKKTYEKYYKFAPIPNTALFEWQKEYDELKPIFY